MEIPMDDSLLTDFERQETKHATIRAMNDERTRRRLAIENRRLGIEEPKVGNRIYATLARGINRRTRAGLAFEKAQPGHKIDPVIVVDGTDDEVAERRKKGERVANLHGAEQILRDDALVSFLKEPKEGDLVASDVVQDLQAQLLAAKQELESLRSQRAARAAEAPDRTDGGPSRLPAARRAREAEAAQAGETPADPFTDDAANRRAREVEVASDATSKSKK